MANAKREPITDPIEWIRVAIDLAGAPTDALAEDGMEILRLAEAERVSKLSDEELSTMLSDGDVRRVVLEEVTRRLAQRAYRVPPEQAVPQDYTFTRPGLPEGYHLTTGPGLPPEGIPCGCIHGEDHDERFFEVPPGGAPREAPKPPLDTSEPNPEPVPVVPTTEKE